MKEQNLPRGESIIGFESLEEMTTYLQQAEEEANTHALPEQQAISWGSRVLRLAGDRENMLAIWGHIYTEAEFLALEEGVPNPDRIPDDELQAELESLRERHQRGYRYGRWFSAVEPSGEFGEAHVVSLWPITQHEFDDGRVHNWHVWPELATRIYQEVHHAMAQASQRDNHEEEGNE